MDLSYIWITILTAASVTFLLRAAPFLVFKNKNKVPGYLIYMEESIPALIMVLLVIYCLKDVNWFASPYAFPELVSILIVILMHLWKANPLLSISSGTVLYMLIVN